MSIEDLVAIAQPPIVSFEFSPPKSLEAEQSLWNAIKRLEPLAPSFVSVTYGAGGSTRDRTHATVRRIVEETNLKPAAHLTCVGHPKSEINAIARAYWDSGIRHIVALRGDMPNMEGPYRAHDDGYASTPEMIEGLRKIAPFEISVSFYPEVHPDSSSLDHDIELLKRKVDVGAQRALGQFCFDNEAIARFRDRAAAAGIAVPIVPGLMPTTAFRGVERMAARCRATIPDWLRQVYDGLDEDLESRRIVAASVLTEQVEALRALGFGQFHFYTLNQANLTYAACRIMGLRPKDKI